VIHSEHMSKKKGKHKGFSRLTYKERVVIEQRYLLHVVLARLEACARRSLCEGEKKSRGITLCLHKDSGLLRRLPTGRLLAKTTTLRHFVECVRKCVQGKGKTASHPLGRHRVRQRAHKVFDSPRDVTPHVASGLPYFVSVVFVGKVRTHFAEKTD